MFRKTFLILFFSCLPLTASALAQSGGKQPDVFVKEKKQTAVGYGIIVDNSGSTRTILETVIKTVHSIVEENKTDDNTFLVRFVDSKNIKVLQDFTGSKDDIHSAAEEMFVEGGATAILDAVSFSGKYLSENAVKDSNRQRVLILITDGDDRQSKSKIEDVLKFLKDEKIRVFTIGMADGKVYTKSLDKLAKETGGESFAPKTGAEILAAVKKITAAMRVQ